MTSQLALRVVRWPHWVRVMLFSVAYFLCAVLGEHFSLFPRPFVTFWLPSGLYVAILLLSHRRTWPWLVLAAYAANLTFDLLHARPLWVTLLFSTGNTLEALAGAWLVQRLAGKRFQLSSARSVLVLVLGSAGFSTMLSATLGASVVALGQGLGDFGSYWLLWWTGDAVGILVLAPLILSCAEAGWLRSTLPRPTRAVEAVTLLLLLAMSTWSIFAATSDVPNAYLLLPLLIYAALRFGPHGAAIGNALVALLSAGMIAAGTGHFASASVAVSRQIMLFQGFLAVTLLTTLALAVLMAERQRVTEVLRQGEERFRLLAEHAQDLIYRYRFVPTRGFEYVSPSATAITGYTPEEHYADPDLGLKIIHPDDRARFLAYTQTGAPDSEPVVWRWIRKDGTLVWTEQHNVRIFDPQRHLIAIEGVARDITARKRAEEERRQLEERLEQVQRFESLGVLAGGIAHDFNNLLTAVLGNAELAQMELDSASPVHANLEEVKRAAQQAATLTGQMLAYAGKGPMFIQAINLSALLHDMRGLLGGSLPDQVTLEYDLAADLPAIQADSAQMRQVVTSLFSNAVEAIGEQEGRIALRTHPCQAGRNELARAYLGERLPEGPYVCLEVADTGCGMDDATRARIFEPFFTTKFIGRGLGLPAVLGIVRSHRGAIQVETAPGRGTTMRVLLPCAAPPVRPPEVPPQTPRSEQAILVVDDEPMVLSMAQRMLERAGWRVLTAADGRRALDLYQARRAEISMVLLDLTMPHMSGEEAFRALRALRPDLPVLMASGYDTAELTQRFAGQGVSGFIHKPYHMDELLGQITALLGA